METSPVYATSGPPYTGEPAVLQRLPREVEYTFIKMILADVPGPLMTAPWLDDQAADEISKRFGSKTYGAVDRALRKIEATLSLLPPDEQPRQRKLVHAFRHAWVQQAVAETGGLTLKPGIKWIATSWTDPGRLGAPLAPTGLDGPGLLIEVWQTVRRGSRLLERWALPAMLMPWRPETGVPWVDPALVNQVYAGVIRTHFRPVLRKWVGHRWRSHREPAGWPILTQHVIPALYDYLRPYYGVRPYQDHRQSRPSGHYPAALRRDITDLIKFECPHLADELTVERVTAAIQRYVSRANPRRPMGIDLFKLRLPLPTPRQRKKPRRK